MCNLLSEIEVEIDSIQKENSILKFKEFKKEKEESFSKFCLDKRLFFSLFNRNEQAIKINKINDQLVKEYGSENRVHFKRSTEDGKILHLF